VTAKIFALCLLNRTDVSHKYTGAKHRYHSGLYCKISGIIRTCM